MLQKIVDGIFKVVEVLIFVFFALMVTLIFVQVFNRFITNNSLTWSEELSRYLMIWFIFLASAVVYRAGKHMAVDNLVNALHGTPQKILKTVSMIFQIIFVAFILWGAVALFPVISGQESPANRINMAFCYAAVPTMGVLMYIAMIENYILKKKPKETDTGVIQL